MYNWFEVGCVCVDDPTAHQLTRWFKHGIAREHSHELQATHTSLGTKMCVWEREREKRVRERDIGAEGLKWEG